MDTTNLENVAYKICSKCDENKPIDKFYKRGLICCECNNYKRRQKYKTDEEYRQKTIKLASTFKHEKAIERQKIKKEEQLTIGLENKQCKYCNEIKHKEKTI